MSDTEEDPGAPLTQADIPTLVRAVADAIGKASATPATIDPPGEPEVTKRTPQSSHTRELAVRAIIAQCCSTRIFP